MNGIRHHANALLKRSHGMQPLKCTRSFERVKKIT